MDAKEALIETYRELLGLLEEEQRQSEHSFRGMGGITAGEINSAREGRGTAG